MLGEGGIWREECAGRVELRRGKGMWGNFVEGGGFGGEKRQGAKKGRI